MTTLAVGATIGRRLLNLYVGLVLFGVSCAMIVASGLGLGPWDVFHQGLSEPARHLTGVGGDRVSALLVLLLWIPLRQRPGLGTVSNAILVGLVIDATLVLLRQPDSMAAGSGLLVAGVILNGVATGLVHRSGFGSGTPGRFDDRPRRPRTFDPGGSHRHRADRPG